MAEEKRVGWESLLAFTEQVFVRAGMPPEDAHTEAEVLLWANLRGVDSHGVLRVLRYVESIAVGDMNPRPDIRIITQTPATMLIEADHALGPVVTVYAMKQVVAKARSAGIGWALIRNTTHQGAMGYYALMAAQENMAGIAFVCSPPNMAPYGAKAAGVHNSPIAIAVPARRHRPLILDMATSVAAAGKVNLAVDKGIPIPEGWALDREGKPTTDSRVATILLPFGGYKASGLAMMFECLASVMVGDPLLEPILLGTGSVRGWTQHGVVAAVNIAAFTDVEAYREHIDRLIEGIKGLPRADGFEEVLVPGEPEDRVHDERLRLGIPLPAGTVENLRKVSQKLGVTLPAGL